MRRARSKRSSRRSSPKITPVRSSRLSLTEGDCRFRRLGCHPASDFCGFTLRVPAGHQSLQTTERTRHVAFTCREKWSIVHGGGLGIVIQKIEPSVVHDLGPNLVGPKQEIG